MRAYREQILLLMETFDCGISQIFHNGKTKIYNPPLSLDKVKTMLK